MKYIYLFLLLISLISEEIISQNYQLVWSDEFNGNALNPDFWTKETGGHGWGNNELEYYTDREVNSYVQDGLLTIKALKETYENRNYTSARIKTQGKKIFRYGKIEAGIKLPYGQGIWPAFWMLGQNISSVGWPKCGEIDIMEMVGGTSGNNSDSKAYGTAHWDDGGHQFYGGNYSLSSGRFADDFHKFSIVWNPQSIMWYIDDEFYFSIDITPETLSEFHNEYFILLNLAVGGNWPGNPDETTVFPQTMQVDYVRVYQNITDLPNINIINPLENSVIDPWTNISIDANVQFEGIVSKVEFFQDAVRIGETIYDPYQLNLLNVSPGCYNVYAIAYTDKGYYSYSDKINFRVGNSCVEAPYKIVLSNIPGEIEAENFNLGGQGIAYNDLDIENTGGAYRINESVDIEECTDDGGGFNVGWLKPNEWMDYLISVSDSEKYFLEARVSSNVSGGGSFHIEFDGVNKTGSVIVPNTNGWQNWITVVSDSFDLNAGEQNMRFVFDSGSININKLGIYHPNISSSLELLSPNGGETWQIGSIQEIRWKSAKVSKVKIGLTTNGGTSWSFITGATTSEFGVYRWKIPESISSSDKCQVQIVDNSNFSVSDISKSYFSITSTTDIGEEQNKLYGFVLMQNYPNPFNPSTKIKYTIPTTPASLPFFTKETEGWFVKLKVYDILGNEVSTLVEEFKSPGSYEVEFDGSKQPGGIYYYRLQVGNYSQTKKFVLLK